jgi:hypothetical protein
MAEHRSLTAYPDPDSISGTLVKRATLHASRRFYATEGVLVYAHTIDGMTNVASEVWLRPSATRRLGQYLDLKQSPSIVGYQIVRQGLQLVGTVPDVMFDEFRSVADTLVNETLELGKRDITLCGVSEVGVDGWPWHGTLTYRHVFSLESGQRIYDTVRVPILVRSNGGNAVDVAVVSWRPSDVKAAVVWLNRLTQNSQGALETAWQRYNIKLVNDPDARLGEIDRIFTSLGGGHLVGLRNPDMKGGGASDTDTFSAILDIARYETRITTIDLIRERMSHDAGIVAGLDGFTHIPDMPIVEKGVRYDPVICLRLHQSDVRAAPMMLTWRSGKRIKSEDLPIESFSTRTWEGLRSVEWTSEEKWLFLARAYQHLIEAHRDRGTDQSTAVATA